MSSKPVFCMITADTCGHCQNLNKKWEPIRKAINSLGTVDLKKIKLKTMGSKIPNTYPAGIQKHLQWFPTGLMFSRDIWNNASRAGNNEDMPGLKMEPTTPLTAEGITGWIKNNVSKLQNKSEDESKSPAPPVRELSRSYAPTAGSRKVCREMNIIPRRRYW